MKYNSTKDPIRIYNEILGGKWRLLILYQLFNRTQRFRDLGQSIEGITPRMLTKELRILEKFNLVEKEIYREVPPRVEYSLTDDGVKLYPLIENIINFGETFAYLLNGTEEDLVQKSLERTAKMKVMEIDLTSEPDIVYNPKAEKIAAEIQESIPSDELDQLEKPEDSTEELSKESAIIQELLETKKAIEEDEKAGLETVKQITQEGTVLSQDQKEATVNIGQKNAEILKQLKPKKVKKFKISEHTNAVQLELF